MNRNGHSCIGLAQALNIEHTHGAYTKRTKESSEATVHVSLVRSQPMFFTPCSYRAHDMIHAFWMGFVISPRNMPRQTAAPPRPTAKLLEAKSGKRKQSQEHGSKVRNTEAKSGTRKQRQEHGGGESGAGVGAAGKGKC